MKRLETFVMVLGAFALLLVLACGPAATSPVEGGQTAQAAQESEPTEVPPTPTPGPTPTPPYEPPPPPMPTIPPPPPTPEPEDQPPPTEEPQPTPTPFPTVTPPSYPAHPDGLEGCKSLNRYSGSVSDFDYHFWCTQASQDDIREHCLGTGNTFEEKQCAYQRLADFKSYTIRELYTPCVAITNRVDRRACNEESATAYRIHSEALVEVWNHIVDAVEEHPDVKNAYRAMADCVADAGYKGPDVRRPLPWQQIDDSKIDTSSYRDPGATGPPTDAEKSHLRVANRCALDEDLYAAQDIAWQEEIWRIFHGDEPDRIAPLKEAGIIDILEEDGPAPFLFNYYFTDR